MDEREQFVRRMLMETPKGQNEQAGGLKTFPLSKSQRKALSAGISIAMFNLITSPGTSSDEARADTVEEK